MATEVSVRGVMKTKNVVGKVYKLYKMSKTKQEIFNISVLSGSIVVYRMGRLCGGAHEISGITAPLFLCGRVVGGFWGGWVKVVGWGLVGWVGGWWGDW